MDAREKATPSYPRVVSKPTGGFRAISLLQVCMAWWAYRTGVLREYLDFRVYLALHEFDEQRLTARRVRAKNRLPSSPSRLSRSVLVGEVRGLVVSSSERVVRASLARLEAIGLVVVSDTGVIFAVNISHLKLDETNPKTTELRDACRGCAAGTRRLPVPRLMLRHIARGAPPAVAATVTGHLVQSVRWIGKEIHVSGACTAEFISDFFGVDLRSVRRGRVYLREAGWLVPDVEPNSNSSGVPNLGWSPSFGRESSLRAAAVCTDLSPRHPESDIDLSPPTYSSQLRSGSRYQQLDVTGGAGSCMGKGRLANPSWSHVVEDDLRDARRLLRLFDQAAQLGLVKRTQADRLRFFAVAERAKRVATRNPCGFFATVVREGKWKVLSQLDEDLAHGVLKKLDTSTHVDPNVRPPGAAAPPEEMTKTGMMNERVRNLVAKLAARCSMAPGGSAGAAERTRPLAIHPSAEAGAGNIHTATETNRGNMRPSVLACGAGPCRPSLALRETSEASGATADRVRRGPRPADGLSEA